MLKDTVKRVGRTEQAVDRAHERIDGHDVVFAALKVDLDYMKKGIDELKEGQKAMQEHTCKE